jgi:hypothetical protein
MEMQYCMIQSTIFYFDLVLGHAGRVQQVPEGAGDGHHRQRQEDQALEARRGRGKCHPGPFFISFK